MGQEHKKQPGGVPKGTLPASAQQLLDDMVIGPMTPEAVQDAFTLLKKAIIERALASEAEHKKGPGITQTLQGKPNNQKAAYSTAFTMLSITFFASPNTIIVLSI